ncbi:MAG: hypothetical protein R2909_16565 [Gemmatimonadales bacterium]
MTAPSHAKSSLAARSRLTAAALATATLSIGCGAPPSGGAVAERSLVVVASEYAFTAPDTVDPGPAVISLRNDGRVDHELIVMKLRPGATLADLAGMRKEDGSVRPFLDGGSAVLFAPPGEHGDGRLAIDLEPGARYALWCNFTDEEGAPEHSALGMIGELVVRASRTGGAPKSGDRPRPIEIAASDYAFTVPDTLPPGLVDFHLRNVGTVRHELTVDKLVEGADPALFFAELRREADVDSFYDSDGAILTAYADGGSAAAIRVELEPGRVYVLTCAFRDHETAPSHLALGMFKALHVRRPDR